jgi:hypothetical protein
MPENYRLMMEYENQGKKYEIHKLKCIVFEICLYYLLDCIKYFLSVNTNSGLGTKQSKINLADIFERLQYLCGSIQYKGASWHIYTPGE